MKIIWIIERMNKKIIAELDDVELIDKHSTIVV